MLDPAVIVRQGFRIDTLRFNFRSLHKLRSVLVFLFLKDIWANFQLLIKMLGKVLKYKFQLSESCAFTPFRAGLLILQSES